LLSGFSNSGRATNPDQVTANAATVDWKFSDEETTELNELL